jgi:hypothetical protein
VNSNNLRFFIVGRWVDPEVPRTIDVVDPSTGFGREGSSHGILESLMKYVCTGGISVTVA